MVVDQASQGSTADATAAIVGQIRAQINEKFADFLGAEGQDYLDTLPEILSSVRTLKVQVEALVLEQATLTGRSNSTAECQRLRKRKSLRRLVSPSSPAATLR